MGSLKDETRSPAEALLEPEPGEDPSSPSASCAPRGDFWSACDITITPAPEEVPDLDCGCVEDVTQTSSGPAAEQPEAGPPDSAVELPTPADTTEAGEPGSPRASLEQLPETDASHTDRDSQKETFHCTTKKQRSQERDTEAEREKVVGGSSGEHQVPGSPARLQHIQTQVSLEVVQCHSVATSPMTPPEGAGAFHFLYSSTKLGAVDVETGGVEMHAGRKVEYRSVATAPMTPRTPTILAFPEASERERVQTEERRVEEGAEGKAEGEKIKRVSEWETSHMEMYPHLHLAPAAKCTTPKKVTKQTASNSDPPSDTSVNCPQTEAVDSNGCCDFSVEDPAEEEQHQHLQRMGTMDQDITILVTHHDSPEDQEEAKEEEGGAGQQTVSAEPDLWRVDEHGELNAEDSPTEVNSAVVGIVTTEQAATGTGEAMIINETRKTPPTDENNTLQKEKAFPNSSGNIQTDKEHVVLQSPNQNESSEQAEGKGIKKTACSSEGTGPGARLQRLDQVPGSPARLQHIQTQVSLEVVQCHSVATSPMTPPEGAGAFHFLYSSTNLGAVDMETGGVEMHAGRKVEYRSVATAPMTPRTPTTLAFPEISERERVQTEERRVEEGAEGKAEGERNKGEMEVKEWGSEEEKKEKADEGSEKEAQKEGKERINFQTKEKTDGKEDVTGVKEKVNETEKEKEGEKEGEKVGEKVGEKEGEKEREKEKEGEKEGEKVGEKVGEKEGEPGGEQEKSEKPAEQKSEENSEELVQEVCWDEKGMTWEVYGAVVEVAVLGSAIQKHLEKQVKKHKKQPSSALPPPPPLSPSATPLPATPPPAGGPGQGEEGKSRAGRRGGAKRGRQRRNPFRLLLQNMQQPHCCSRAHAAE
ncbi:uncharacterized protein LOC134032473 isoform X1 [Osmerus eperlanus]|uniref:uncharacterized protein LOC134032473 isoform X1 n=1 Tax=Osmerus eperlanus TaxID=29151 RepID=UPI002E13D67E